MIELLPTVAPDAAIYADLKRNVTEEFHWDNFESNMAMIDEERHKFVESGYTENPNFRPREVDQEGIDRFTEELTDMLFNLETTITDSNARLLYTWRINEQLANVEMVVSAYNGNAEKFRADNEFLYGPPDPEIFGASADWFAKEAEQAIEAEVASETPRIEVIRAATRVIAALDASRGDASMLIPNEDVFQAARERTYAEGGFMHKLLDGIELPDGMIDASIGDDIMRQMLTNIGGTPVIVDSDGGWSITPEALKRPPNYNMTRQEFIEFLAHELRHRYESVMGDVNKFRLPTTGISRYEQGNEGRGVVTEALTNENFEDFTKGFRWHELLSRHLAASLSRGMAAGQRSPDFSHTYDVIKNAMIVFESQKTGASSVEEITEKAHDNAWDIVNLVYLGTDGTGNGGGWLRPMIYLQGFVEVFKAEAAHPGIIEVGDRGKFNVADLAQMSLLQTLDVVDAHDMGEHDYGIPLHTVNAPHDPDEDS